MIHSVHARSVCSCCDLAHSTRLWKHFGISRLPFFKFCFCLLRLGANATTEWTITKKNRLHSNEVTGLRCSFLCAFWSSDRSSLTRLQIETWRELVQSLWTKNSFVVNNFSNAVRIHWKYFLIADPYLTDLLKWAAWAESWLKIKFDK